MTATYTRGTATTKITTNRLTPGTALLTADLHRAENLVGVADKKSGAMLRIVSHTQRVAPGPFERNTRVVVHFTDGTHSPRYSASQTWMALVVVLEPVADAIEAAREEPTALAQAAPVTVPAAATRDEVTITVPAPARFAAVREDGRYRVVTTGVGAAAPGRVVATCSSKAKAEEKAAKLNADLAADLAEAPAVIADTAKLTEERAATITRNPVGAVADAIRSGRSDFLGTVGELLGGATLDQIAARQDAAPAAARVLPRTDVEDRVEASMARKATKADAAPAEDKPVNVYVGASVAELIIPRTDDADTAVASVARKLADRQPNAQNYRHVKLSAAERGALAGVATAIENDATTAGQGLLARAARTLRARIAATD